MVYEPDMVWFHVIFRLVLRPFNGFFNMLIFVYHKVHNLRRRNPGISYCVPVRESFRERQLEYEDADADADADLHVSNVTLVLRREGRLRVLQQWGANGINEDANDNEDDEIAEGNSNFFIFKKLCPVSNQRSGDEFMIEMSEEMPRRSWQQEVVKLWRCLILLAFFLHRVIISHLHWFRNMVSNPIQSDVLFY